MAKAWFAPKRYGYGSSFPISWEGWAVLFGFIGAVILVGELSHQLLPKALATPVSLCGIVILVGVFAAVARAKTDGGWRWRKGEGP